MSFDRRNVLKRGVVGVAGVAVASHHARAASAKSYGRIMGSNERIHVAVQGLGGRGRSFAGSIGNPANNAELLYLCDVADSRLEKAARVFAEKGCSTPVMEKDVRNILADERVDAVIMATPDHWHAPGACMAMAAGKHVYVEKPCSHNMHENELIVQFRDHYKCVVQMGNQQRSSLETQEIIRALHEGLIGEMYKATTFYVNKRGSVPRQQAKAVPAGLDWNLFQGPAPRKEYVGGVENYIWHWYGWDYGTAEMGNNATHELDIARWALAVDLPEEVSVRSGKHQYIEDGWEMYDSMEARFEFEGGKVIEWDGQSRNGYPKYGRGRGTIIYGASGSVFVDRNGYQVFGLGGKLVRDSKSKDKEEGMGVTAGGGMSERHVRNFFAAIRGEEALASPIEQGAVSQAMTHYANIAARTGKNFGVDSRTGRIFDRDAMQLWSREYEPGWEPKI